MAELVSNSVYSLVTPETLDEDFNQLESITILFQILAAAIYFENCNLTLLDMCTGLSQLCVSNQKEESISVQSFNGI